MNSPASRSHSVRHRPAAAAAGAPDPATSDVSAAAAPSEQVGLELAREMRRRWRAGGGERPRAEEFLAAHPDLWHQPEAAVELIYEEYCLRRAAGDAAAEHDILQRFPQWAGPLRVMLDCHSRVIHTVVDRPRFPEVGEQVGGFRLLAALGRGSRGRVFLAAQTGLADRHVVLKVTPLDGGEHLSLARLQHTNIVPLHSVVDDPARGIRVLCMPYFGRATLASLLSALADLPPAARTGRHVIDAIDRAAGPDEPGVPASSSGAAAPARQMLAHASYDQAICWVAACLADALQFAHSRGLAHLDLKPSNVLLSNDAQPMLLDFHLAREPVRPQCPPPENFGGTPPYMPPEQRAALRSLGEGVPADVAVDGRADVYALGAMVYEALGGRLPITGDSPPLPRVNPRVSDGLGRIVARCVADRPQDRYPDAAALAEDLRRHLTDRPLAGVPNRGVTERWRKWRRRRPGTLHTAAAVAAVCGALVVAVVGGWSHLRDRHAQAERALYDGQRQLLANSDEAAQTLERGLGLIDGLPFEDQLRGQLRDRLAAARRQRLAGQIHRLADEARVLYGGTDALPADDVRSVAARCTALWDRRDAVVTALDVAAADADLAADLQDIAIFAASLQPRLAPDGADDVADPRRAAMRMLDEAEAMFGPSAVIDHERRRHRSATRPAGSTPDASAGAPPPPPPVPSPRTAWEHYALGRALLASDDLPRAAQELAAARTLDPAGLWSNFYFGLCAYRMGRHEDAVAAFSVCIGAAPDLAGCYYNRARAYAALDRPEHALHDYDRALAIDPTHAPAALNRGMLHFQQQRHAQALADLRAALAHGADPASVHYDLALVHIALDQPEIALDHATRAVEVDPASEPARRVADSLRRSVPRRASPPNE